MLLQLGQINTSVEQGIEDAPSVAIGRLGLKSSQVISAQVIRTSVDARRGRRLPVHFVSTVAFEVTDEIGEKLLRENIKELSPITPAVPIEVKRVRHRFVIAL